ncbi:MAG: hypothetical protein Q7T26_12550 [Dehalococcoidia bacterium]|nr:hypothetical protein [Dehalococcoidia bacterium]
MTNLQQIRGELLKGFYLRNLDALARLCNKTATDSARPLPFFVMQCIFLRVAADWRERPMTPEEASQWKQWLGKPLEDVIAGLENGAPENEMYDILNKLVSAYSVAETFSSRFR